MGSEQLQEQPDKVDAAVIEPEKAVTNWRLATTAGGPVPNRVGASSTISRFSTYPPVVLTTLRSTISTAIHSR